MPHFADGQRRTVKFGRATLASGAALVTVNTTVPADTPETYAPLTDISFAQLFATPVSFAPVDAFNPMIIGRVLTTGGVGPFTYQMTYTIDGAAPTVDRYRIGLEADMPANITSLFDVTSSTDVLHITITDALGVAVAKNFTVSKAAPGPRLLMTPVGYSDLNYTNAYYQNRFSFFTGGTGHTSADTLVLTPPAGWNVYTNSVFPPETGLTAGTYSIHAVATGGGGTISGDFSVVITGLPTIGPFVFTPATISTSAVSGTLVGRFLATTPTNSRVWSISGADAANFTFNSLTGDLKVKSGLTAGDKHITVTCTDRLASKSRNFVINVQVGTTVSSSNMTMTIPTGLDNWQFGQTVGTPTVTGIPGAKAWSMTYPDQGFTNSSDGSSFDAFVIHPTTGAISVPGQPSNRIYPLTVTCTDGINTCTRQFDIPIAWRAGPTLHVGRGMAAAHPGTGFEFMRDVMPYFMAVPDSAHAGATILVHPDGDPNYYAGDNGGAQNDYGLRYGWHGPVKLQSSDPNVRVRCGGHVGSIGEGSDMRGKGFFNIEDRGDFILEGFEVSYVGGTDYSHGLSNIRKNGDTTGDVWLKNCYIHHGNNGFESGTGPYLVRVTDCEFADLGDIFVSTGHTHNLYIGGHSQFVMENCLSYASTNGHLLKTRALNGTITGSRFFDGERGSSICQIDIPNGGNYSISGCDFQKGPQPSNPHVVQFFYEGLQPDETRTHLLGIANSRFNLITPPGNHDGPAVAVAVIGAKSSVTGNPLTVNIQNSSFYLYPTTTILDALTDNPYNSYLGVAPVINQSGTTTLTAPFALDFTNPGGISHPVPGFYSIILPSTDNYNNFSGVQQNPGTEDIRISAGTATGTTLCTISAYGHDWAKLTSPTDPGINPFGAGSTWSLVQDPPYYSSAGLPWAPVGRYTITTNSDGTGTLKVGTSLAAGVDLVQVRVVGPSSKGSVVCDHRYYVVKT